MRLLKEILVFQSLSYEYMIYDVAFHYISHKHDLGHRELNYPSYLLIVKDYLKEESLKI